MQTLGLEHTCLTFNRLLQALNSGAHLRWIQWILMLFLVDQAPQAISLDPDTHLEPETIFPWTAGRSGT